MAVPTTRSFAGYEDTLSHARSQLGGGTSSRRRGLEGKTMKTEEATQSMPSPKKSFSFPSSRPPKNNHQLANRWAMSLASRR